MTGVEIRPLMSDPGHQATALMIAVMARCSHPEQDEAILAGCASRIVFAMELVRRAVASMPGPAGMDPDELAAECEPPYTLDPGQYRAGAELLSRELGARSDLQRAFVHRIAKDELFQLLVDLTDDDHPGSDR
jgi:hypothetical protein